MSLSLHTATVSSFLQILPQVEALVDKAGAWCRDKGAPEAELLEARLADDMWPFGKQVAVVSLHSAGALAGVKNGVFRPNLDPAPTSFAALRQMITDAIADVKATDPAELDRIGGQDMRFEFGDRHMDFTLADFLLSFALPNFYFHASAAYAILRNQGLPIGKMDFLGRPRIKA